MSNHKGFASLSPERLREIASLGGKAAHAQGKAHHWSPEAAKTAGQKGGATISQNREHMANIGRKGGLVRAAAKKAMLVNDSQAE